MTGNESKIQEGREKKLGDSTPSSNPVDTDSNANTDTQRERSQLGIHDVDRERDGRVEIDETATRYQHGNYTGPNLTAPPPLHYSPSNDHDHNHDNKYEDDNGQHRDHSCTRLEEEDDQAEAHEYEHEQGEVGLGGYDLHGGFPTGAPSPLPSGRGRGAGVFDPFDRAGGDNGRVRGHGGIQL